MDRGREVSPVRYGSLTHAGPKTAYGTQHESRKAGRFVEYKRKVCSDLKS